MYGTLLIGGSKATSPSGNQVAPEPPWVDPRHAADTPVPWLRYFFPKDFDLREGSPENPWYQYFDVTLEPLQEDITVRPPPWTPNAYFRLSFTQTYSPTNQDVAERMPVHDSPVEALDFTNGNWPLFADGAEKHLAEVKRFCRSVTTFKARTWKDAFPLVDLLRGLLTYLLNQMDNGQKLAYEYARRDAQRMVEEEKKRFAAHAQQKIAEKEAEMRAELQATVATAKEAARKAITEEMAAQMKALSEEKEKWVAKSIAGEQQAKKLNESIAALQRQVEQLHEQVESAKVAHAKALETKDASIKAASARTKVLLDALSKSRRCIVDALRARGRKAEVLSVVTAAAALAVPGAHAYVAQLRTVDTVGEEDPALAAAAVALADADESLKDALTALRPGFLSSPLSAPLQLAGEAGAAKPVLEEVQAALLLKYTQASTGQDFMASQTLPYGTGVSWAPITTAAKASGPGSATGAAAAGAAAAAAAMLVQDVSERDGVHFFRPTASTAASHGSYLAVPLVGSDGQVVGLLGVDTLAVATAAAVGGSADTGPGVTQLGVEQVEFLKGLGCAVSEAIARDQEALADIMFKASLMKDSGEEAAEQAPTERDPEQFADLHGGMTMFKTALGIMKGLTDEDLAVFQSVDKPDDATLAILCAALAAAGEVSDGDWPQIREQVSRNLINKLLKLDPKGAWAEWKDLCQVLSPLMAAESELGRIDSAIEGEDEPRASTPGADEQRPQSTEGWAEANATTTTKALGRWLAAVRKVSAAQALLAAYQERLHRANEAMLRTFQGDGSNALVELRTYRVPPKITFQVLQVVLALAGSPDADCNNWGRMRLLTNYKMIKKLVEMRPENAMVPHVKMCMRVARSLDEEDVRKESMATLVLFKWLKNFAKVGELTLQA